MPRTSLSRRLAERFREIDGGHPTTGADDAYVVGFGGPHPGTSASPR
ncbi:hypothetical protein [Streptomyces misionensis]